MGEPLLSIENLRTHFYTDEGIVKAVDGVDMWIRAGETLAVVGESGCGKSVTALSIMRLVQSPPARILEDSTIRFGGQELTGLSEEAMRHIRGNQISMIFQEPMTSLNPVFKAGSQVAEAISLHQDVTKRQAIEMAVEMMAKVGIPDPAQRAREYPHQFSGGMRQRIMIAMALACNPKLMIADEPTTALDVTIQAQILNLLVTLQNQFDLTYIFISHDLGVVRHLCNRVAVMYLGRIVELAPAMALYSSPRHPYTEALLSAVPVANPKHKKYHKELVGDVPSPIDPPTGCRFHPRCPYVQEVCKGTFPPLRELSSNHMAACHLPVKGG